MKKLFCFECGGELSDEIQMFAQQGKTTPNCDKCRRKNIAYSRQGRIKNNRWAL